MSTGRSTRRARRIAILAICAGFGIGTAVEVAPSASALPRTGDMRSSFTADAATAGAIPDATFVADNQPQNPGVRDVSIPVTGLRTPLSDVRVTVALAHSDLGDLGVYLIAPDGTTATLFDRVAAPGESDGSEDASVNGVFTFSNDAPKKLADSEYIHGPSHVLLGGLFLAQGLGGSFSDVTTPFINTALNGTWRIRVVDYAQVDTGRVSSAGLTFFSNAGAQGVECERAGIAVFAAALALRAETKAFSKVKKNLKKAKRKQESDRKIAKMKKKKRTAKHRVTASSSSLAAAQAAKSAICV